MKGKRVIVTATATFAFLGVQGAPHAATLKVPEDFPSILTAVDAAAAGDSVLVGPGLWDQVETRQVPINGSPTTVTACAFLKAGLTVVGAGAEATVVRQGGVGSGRTTFIFASQGGEPVRLERMTVEGGAGSFGVIGSIASGLEIRECTVSQCELFAIDLQICPLVLEDTVFRDNDTAILIDATESDLEVRRCEFVSNIGWAIAARGIFTNQYPAIVEDCRFEDTEGVQLHVSPVQVLRNVFTQSVAGAQLAVVAYDNLEIAGSISHNVFDRLTVVGPYVLACVDVDGFSGDVSHNTWSNCSSNLWAVAGVFDLLDGGSFRNNVIAGCTGSPALSVVSFSGGTIDVGCNDYWNNAGGNFREYYPEEAQDFFVDPMFCDPENGDVTLQSGSFLAEGNNPICGQIGAYGIGCGTVSIRPETWAAIKAMYRKGGGS